MKRLITSAILMLSITLAAAVSLRADSISLYSYAAVQLQVTSTPECVQTSASGSAVSCNQGGSVTGSGSTITVGGTASAAATFGVLHAASSSGAGCNVFGVEAGCSGLGSEGAGDASFSDWFTITGAPATGYVDLSVVVDGTGSLACSGPYATSVCEGGEDQDDLQLPGGTLADGISTANFILGSGTTDVSLWVPFTSDDGDAQLAGGFGLEAYSSCYYADDTSCSAFANFFDTAYVSGLTVLDQNGNPVPGAIVTAASGTNYNDIQVPSAVPEPSDVALLGAGALSMCILARRSIPSRKSATAGGRASRSSHNA